MRKAYGKMRPTINARQREPPASSSTASPGGSVLMKCFNEIRAHSEHVPKSSNRVAGLAHSRAFLTNECAKLHWFFSSDYLAVN